jgi:hypothetical protein
MKIQTQLEIKGPMAMKKKVQVLLIRAFPCSAMHTSLHLIACRCIFAMQQDVRGVLVVRDYKIVRRESVPLIMCVLTSYAIPRPTSVSFYHDTRSVSSRT